MGQLGNATADSPSPRYLANQTPIQDMHIQVQAPLLALSRKKTKDWWLAVGLILGQEKLFATFQEYHS